ncbi:hypothetical protein BDP27DRAFT_1329545 [Rhodocollybia butyracea]|uniref:Uncharacterized protein n=1 Tax=Rhodocollybia butyracea TaxID=206335 RepID=A0A9P5PN73_9AGAR|nr:hypothetical protein BDP27DRAFT_1329545 [Rhodocollybia butyracea]
MMSISQSTTLLQYLMSYVHAHARDHTSRSLPTTSGGKKPGFFCVDILYVLPKGKYSPIRLLIGIISLSALSASVSARPIELKAKELEAAEREVGTRSLEVSLEAEEDIKRATVNDEVALSHRGSDVAGQSPNVNETQTDSTGTSIVYQEDSVCIFSTGKPIITNSRNTNSATPFFSDSSGETQGIVTVETQGTASVDRKNTVLSALPTPVAGEITVDGVINASFRLVVPSTNAVFPQVTAPSSPTQSFGLSGNLLMVNAEAGGNGYNTTTYLCEPDSDALMLRLLAGLIAAILLINLMNTIKSWVRPPAEDETMKTWHKEWKRALFPGPEDVLSNVQQNNQVAGSPSPPSTSNARTAVGVTNSSTTATQRGSPSTNCGCPCSSRKISPQLRSNPPVSETTFSPETRTCTDDSVTSSRLLSSPVSEILEDSGPHPPTYNDAVQLDR